MTTCKAWIPTDSGNRYCSAPATARMQVRHEGMVPVCRGCYDAWRDRLP